MVGLALIYIPQGTSARRGSVDVASAVTVTAGLLAIVYAINKSVDYGWTSPTTLAMLAGGAGLFVVVETKAAAPLIPLAMFQLRTLTAANIAAALVLGSFFGLAFQTTLFLQEALGYSPLRTGLANIPATLGSVVVASVIAARVVGRLGCGRTLVIGQTVAVAGLLYLSRAPVHAAYWRDLFPAFLALGTGIGLSGVAVQVAAFIGVKDKVSSLAGGIISIAREVGAAVGLAIIATAAAARSTQILNSKAAQPAVRALALTGGFQALRVEVGIVR